LNIRQLFSNALGHFFSLDSVVPKTILDLSRNPGQVAKHYVDGQRVTYVAPFRYCLTAVALMMVTYALVGNSANFTHVESKDRFSPSELKFQVEIIEFLMRHLNKITLASLPIQALVVKWLFRKSRFNYAEVTSFSLYVLGHMSLVGSILALVLYSNSELQIVIHFLFQLVYGVWAAIGFFGEKVWTTFVKVAIASIINGIIAFIFILILLLPKIHDMKEAVDAEDNQTTSILEDLETSSCFWHGVGGLPNKKLNPTIVSVTLCAGAQTAPATLAG